MKVQNTFLVFGKKMKMLNHIWVPLFAIFNFFIIIVTASHFRGGTISWRYLGPHNKVEFKFRLGWALGSADNSTNWMAVPMNGDPSFAVGSVGYIQTATNTAENWEQGERTFTYDFPTLGPYSVSFTGGAWISLAMGTGGSWNIETIVDLHKRSDTHQPNYSPLTTSRGMYRVQFGCTVSMQLPMIDSDGDNVRCRWATQTEALSISNGLPNASLNETNCKLEFTADTASNYSSSGWYAVALMVEDFPKTTITINGQVYTPSMPISKISLQFLIKTENIQGKCGDIPKFVIPTPIQGTVRVLKANMTMTLGFYVHSTVGLNSIDITGAARITQSSITRDNQGRSHVWYVRFSWTPRQHDQGTHLICGSAEDNYQKLSDTRCFTVIAWDIDPCESNPCKNHATCNRVGYTTDYTCSCVSGFTGILCETEINECLPSPCQHGGKCLDLINTYKCHCSAGFTGTNCENDIDECHSNPCANSGTCTDLIDGYVCRCVNGYTGTDCQIDIDECHSNPCINNGTCVDGIASWTCACLHGFIGVHCQIDIDKCNSDPCLHNGTCIDLINGYSCQCNNDSRGDNCEIWMDHCNSAPCLHGGLCRNQYGGYTCDCPGRWHGDMCEYTEINRTDVCTDLDYTECSCHISRLRQPTKQNYKIWSCIVGISTGILGITLSYVLWKAFLDKDKQVNKIGPKIVKYDIDSEDSNTETKLRNKKNNYSIQSCGPLHCDCFVDHTGYDHFQRYDEKSNRFQFHNCRHKRSAEKFQ